MFYNFCGTFDKSLRADYRKSKSKEKGITFPQFCIAVYSNLLDEVKEKHNVSKSKVAKMQSV